MIEYRKLKKSDIIPSLFHDFVRTQQVTQCWRRENGAWVVKDIAFVDDWGEAEYKELIRCLQNTVETGGLVMGAFLSQRLAGFVSVEREPLGSRGQYMDLSSIHVSQDMRGHGIGKILFFMAADFARENGAEKLYISGHSAVETQAFYRRMGCREAEEHDPAHVEREPCDCQLECDVDTDDGGCTSRKLVDVIREKLPASYEKAAFYYESSLNQQTVELLFRMETEAETGVLYRDSDLMKSFGMKKRDYENWIKRLHHICRQIHHSYAQLTGDTWYRMDISLAPGEEPVFRFSMEDWCDVSERLKRMLLSKREFGVIMKNDENLLQAYEAFMLRHKDEIPKDDRRDVERACRDLLECFMPHSFTEQMEEDARRWLAQMYEKYKISCTEDQIKELAKMLLYAFEREGEPLTEDVVRRIQRTECIWWVKEPPAKKYEYYYVPEV